MLLSACCALVLGSFLTEALPSLCQDTSLSQTFHSKIMATAGKGVLLKADSIAETFRKEIKSALSSAPRTPKLVGILATSSAPSKFYSEFTKKQCDALGVEFVLKKTGSAADESLAPGEGVEEAIIEANEDDSVDGIMVRRWLG